MEVSDAMDAAQQPLAAQAGDQENSNSAAVAGKRTLAADQESIQLKVQFGKDSVTVERLLDSTVLDLKKDVEERTGIPPGNQRLLYKGQLKDANTLREAGLRSGCKIMVLGSAPQDSAAAAKLGSGEGGDAALEWDAPKQEACWSESDQHKKVLGKGRPEDGWPGVKDRQVPLREDQTYIPGLLTGSQGIKVRLTFKPELGQLWVGSATSTQKVLYASVAKIESQPIKGQEEYSIVRLQLGTSATSNLWLYYVPSQCVSGIKLRILGVSALL